MTTLNLTARALAKFPARVVAGVGMAINKANGIWTIAFSSAGLATQPVTDAANTEVIIEMPNGSLAKATVSGIQASTPAYVEETGKKNALINGGFQIWQRTVNDAAVTTTRKYVADRWAVKTGAGTLTKAYLVRTRDFFPQLTRCWGTLSLNGNAGVTTVDLDQRIEAINCSPLNGPVTFSAYIWNGTGSAFTPTLFVSTPTVEDNWAVSNVRNGGGAGDALQSCSPAGGGVTRVFWSADISGYTDLSKGLEFRLRFPNGSLDSNTKTIAIMEVQVERRPSVDNSYTLFEVETFSDELARCQRYYQKSFPYGTAPATAVGAPGLSQGIQVVGASTVQAGGIFVRFAGVMRAAPTITTYNFAAANALARNLIAGVDVSAQSFNEQADTGFRVAFTTGAGTVAGTPNGIHWAADAEL